MDWYIVIKTINGHRYYYRQKTWREGGQVRTRSEYIGPAGSEELGPSAAPDRTPPETPAFSPELTVGTEREAFKSVSGPVATSWDHAWSASRRGSSLVRRDGRVDRLLESLNVKWMHGTDGAFYRPATDEINIPPVRCFLDKGGQSATSAYYIVVFHELVHWTKAKGRSFRPGSASRMEYAKEELVAELGAVMLMKHLRIDVGNEGRHALYFQSWLRRAGDEEKALAHAKREAARAVKFILERGIMHHV